MRGTTNMAGQSSAARRAELDQARNRGLLQVVVGGQYGSEGKGAVAAHLASQSRPAGRYAVRVAGPNAGHTVIDPTGRAWPLRSVPVAAVKDPAAQLVLAAGSEIDPQVTEAERVALDDAGFEVSSRLMIDDQATVIDAQRHQGVENGRRMHERLGSTAKGIGAARSDRLMRTADLYGSGSGNLGVGSTANLMMAALDRGANVQIEGTQGYGLGLHAGFYPYCTSSDCRAVDFLAMAGLSPWQSCVDLEVYVAVRPNPIRVAGNSGPMLGETTWHGLGLEAEHTTVTKKVRRVGAWDTDLVRAAVRANGGAPVVRLALTMADHRFPVLAGQTGKMPLSKLPSNAAAWISAVQDECAAPVALIGTGPDTMIEVDQ